MSTPKIVPVPEKMQKFYGKGTMLHPSLEMVTDLVSCIPVRKISTIAILAKKMAEQYGADVSCPMRTGNHLKRLSKTAASHRVPFWRVLRNNGLMIQVENYAHWAAVLEKEGFSLLYTKSEQVQLPLAKEDIFYFD